MNLRGIERREFPQRAARKAAETLLRATVGHVGDNCLLWPYAVDHKTGYAKAMVGRLKKNASRWMCIFAHGEPPSERHQAAHSCGNRICFNPNHIRWDTPTGNALDRIAHGTDSRGERNNRAALTSKDISSIRDPKRDVKGLIAQYSVSKSCISQIRNRNRWGHVE